MILCVHLHREMTEIIEGQVVEFEMSKPADGVGPKSGKLKLKTMKMENTYELGCKMIDALIIGKVLLFFNILILATKQNKHYRNQTTTTTIKCGNDNYN